MSSSKSIQHVRNILKKCQGILIGAGAGLSAAGGLNFVDPKYFKKHYPEYYKLGFKTLWECVGNFWECTEENYLQYYAFWATHINNERYQTKSLQIYQNLLKLVKDKNYFVATTNVDGQFLKSGFDTKKLFAMQGDYSEFQCPVPCTQEVFNNYEMVQNMLKNMNHETLAIQESDIPKCPHCGKMLVPHLRKDDLFVEGPNLITYPNYEKFLNENADKKIVLLELGVGFNSPGALKIPFEEFIVKNKNWRLVRINLDCESKFYYPIERHALVIHKDLDEVIKELLK